MTKRSIPLGMILLLIFLLTIFSPGNSPAASEGRAVWIHATAFSNLREEALGEMRKTLDDYRVIGINNLYCFYPLMEDHKKGWDFFKDLLGEAHARSIKVHPIFMPAGLVDLHEKVVREHPEWLVRGLKGEIYPSLNPALPEVRSYFIGKISEALAYDIDGIHLDYIRFPDRFSFDAATCAAFQKEYGYSPLERARGNGDWWSPEWIHWNARQVTSLVRDVRELLKKSGRNLVLSAAVFPDSITSVVKIGQEWGKWPQEKLVDVLCPMSYTNNPVIFREWIREAVQVADGNCQVYAGVACLSSHNQNTPDGVVQEVAIAREEGAGGVVFFSGSSLTREFMDRLGATVFAKRTK